MADRTMNGTSMRRPFAGPPRNWSAVPTLRLEVPRRVGHSRHPRPRGATSGQVTSGSLRNSCRGGRLRSALRSCRCHRYRPRVGARPIVAPPLGPHPRASWLRHSSLGRGLGGRSPRGCTALVTTWTSRARARPAPRTPRSCCRLTPRSRSRPAHGRSCSWRSPRNRRRSRAGAHAARESRGAGASAGPLQAPAQQPLMARWPQQTSARQRGWWQSAGGLAWVSGRLTRQTATPGTRW